MHFPPHNAPASGAQGLVGYSIDLNAADGTSKIVLDVGDQHLNRNGTLHGGIHAMMLDAAAGFAASRHLADGSDQIVPVVTLSLSTSFVAAISKGCAIATGQVTGGGFKIVYATAQIVDAAGVVCSTASGVFKRAAK
ncbi:MAG: PaaI family thioesterase [Paracoccaceae bacterium]